MKLNNNTPYLKGPNRVVVVCECGTQFLYPPYKKFITCPKCKCISHSKWVLKGFKVNQPPSNAI